jgi:hypothetical protein
VNESYGIYNSLGVDNALFLANKKRTYSIFGVEVNEKDFEKIKSELFDKLKGWKPTFNNLKSLYSKSGGEWKCTPIPFADEISKQEAWKDMPKEAVEYLKGLKYFNAEMFKKITGINVKESEE